MQNTSAEEIEGGAAIWRPLGRLELVHFSLHLPVTPVEAHGRLDGLTIQPETPCYPLQFLDATRLGPAQPGVQLLPVRCLRAAHVGKASGKGAQAQACGD
jgi:hypothetical protein